MDHRAATELRRRLDAQIAGEWRRLGFWYDLDEAAREWRLAGSRDGLLRFATLLEQYVQDPRNDTVSEHEHYGPYGYLEVMTAEAPAIDGHAIAGTKADLLRLAGIVRRCLATARLGDEACIRSEYAADATHALRLSVRDAAFDPASADPSLAGDAGRG